MRKTKLRRGRVARLIWVLKRVPEEKFNMEYWSVRNSCGTVGCAAGHAAYDPVLRRQGLKLVRSEPAINRSDMLPVFAGLRHLDAVQAFFGMTPRQARNIFMPSAYVKYARYGTPPSVAEVTQRVARLLERDRAAARSGL